MLTSIIIIFFFLFYLKANIYKIIYDLKKVVRAIKLTFTNQQNHFLFNEKIKISIT